MVENENYNDSPDYPNCPKCSTNTSSYLFCKNCSTYYCMTCDINYYIEDNNIIESHNPHCDKKSDNSSINLSDYDE